MSSLCGRVVYIIVAQVHGTKCQMLLMWRPARMFSSAHEPELTLSAQQDSGKKISPKGVTSACKGDDPTVLFITDAAS